MNNKILLMKKINKSFPGVKALDEVDLNVDQNEIHALVGENGAGKSTLMKILTGVFEKDSGEIYFSDSNKNLEKVNINSPRYAQELGISIVYQEFNLPNNLSIAENIFLGREPVNFWNKKIRWNKMVNDAKKYLKEVGLNLDPETKVENLSVAQKQMVEVAKALSFTSKLIIMDEPTATLTNEETKTLFKLMRDLRDKGVSIIFISHRLEEVFEIADRITVMRDGKYIDTLPIQDTDENTIVKMMVGRKFKLENENIKKNLKMKSQESVLEIKNLKSKNNFENINFDLHKGEIVGLFGLVGAGRSELARSIFGIDSIQKGEIYINSKKVEIGSPRDAIELGMALVPEDRKEYGLVLDLNVKHNISLSKLLNFKSILFGTNLEEEIANKYIKSLDIRTTGMKQLAKQLSGGNQQKVVIGKWLSLSPKILILDEPTRGIDVAAKAEIHNLIRKLSNKGTGILMISSELPEILNISDRVMVMHEGSISLKDSKNNLDGETIMQAAVGRGQK